MALQDTLDSYRASVVTIRGYINLAFQVDAAGAYILPQVQRDFITESAFLRVYIAWETFLESAFTKYMTGLPTKTGGAVTTYVTPLDQNHANNMLIGLQSFVDWSRPDAVIKLSSLYFDVGNPFQTHMSTIIAELQDLKTIRNALAHLSSTTSVKLDALGSRLLGRPVTAINPSALLFSVDPLSVSGSTIIDSYFAKLDIVAEGIATG